MINRQTDIGLVRTALKRSRVVAVLGPRQCGKTTLARQFVAADSLNYFDLEDPPSVARLAEPDTALRPLRGLVVIDEIQRRPELFPLLRVLADRKPSPARFLILGSAAPDLLSQSSESLAGRLETVLLEGFRLRDLGPSARAGSGCGADFRWRTRPRAKAIPWPGGVNSYRHFWNATCRNWASRFRPSPWGGSGTCWRTITPNLERGRVGPRAGRQRTDRAPLPRSVDRRLHASATVPVV